MLRFLLCVAIALAIMVLSAGAQGPVQVLTIDFEGYPENTPVSNQYAAYGAVFSIEGHPTELPIIAVEGAPALGIAGFKQVMGRCFDYVTTSDGAIVHSLVFTDAVRTCPKITCIQVVQTDSTIRIDYTASESLSDGQIAAIFRL